MRQFLTFLYRFVLFLLLVFAFWRIVFLIVNGNHKPAFTFNDSLLTLMHGMRMDLAVISYLISVPLLGWLLAQHWKRFPLRTVIRILLGLMMICIVLVLSGNLIIYNFWGSLLNYRALSYMAHPVEVLSSLTGLQLMAFIIVLPALIIFHVYLMNKTMSVFRNGLAPVKFLQRWAMFFLLAAVLVLGMRGGWQMLPMNESLIYFSRNEFLNQVAINPVWHLSYDINIAEITRENPFNHMPEEVSESEVSKALSDTATIFPKVLSSERPNIVLLILESHTGDVVGALGGEKNVSPQLDKLAAEGLLFDNIYSSGSRTDQGIVSVLNGWPATPYHSIMKSPEKSRGLPSVVKILDSLGYSTSFYYGGERNFANMNSYLLNQDFQSIIGKEDFPAGASSGKWGYHDSEVLSKQLSDLDHQSQPFFSVVMTLSNHEPFDVPGKARFSGSGVEDRFRNAAAYADACIGAYMDAAKKKSWFENTLFILVADHGHQLPQHRDEIFPNSRHIPLIWFGNVLKDDYKGVRVNRLGGHHDLPPTLLLQMGIHTRSFTWSKNLLSPASRDFAYYQVGQYLGWIEPGEWMAYSYGRQGFAVDSSAKTPVDTLLHRSRAFLQKLYGQYLAY